MRFWTAWLVLSCVACAHGTTVEKLRFDTYRITCRDAGLDQCLAEAANNACDRRAYFVERGISDVNLKGSSEAAVPSRSSQAIVRCGPATGWGEKGQALMSQAPADAASAPKPVASQPPPPVAPSKPAPVCAPGSTQACVGTAGCSGGQACLADGSGYSPCDCGPPPSLPPSPPATLPQ